MSKEKATTPVVAEHFEADPERELPIEDMEVEPISAQPDPARAELEATAKGEPTPPWLAKLGKDGKPMTAEQAKALYDRLELTPETLAAGQAAGMEPQTLWQKAEDYRAVYPDRWRKLLADHIAARAAGDLSVLNVQDKISRGLLQNPAGELVLLEARLVAALNLLRPEDRVVVLDEVVQGLEIKTKMIVLKKGLIKDLEAKKIAELSAGGKEKHYG